MPLDTLATLWAVLDDKDRVRVHSRSEKAPDGITVEAYSTLDLLRLPEPGFHVGRIRLYRVRDDEPADLGAIVDGQGRLCYQDVDALFPELFGSRAVAQVILEHARSGAPDERAVGVRVVVEVTRHGEPLDNRMETPANRLARARKLAEEMLRDSDRARAWMNEPNARLGGNTPAKVCETEEGARQVEDVIGQIRRGVY